MDAPRTPRERRLTTVGLPLRKELLVRSLLAIVNAKTNDRWSFSDDIDADVAICDPQSDLSEVAQRHSQRSGAPRCVSLIVDGGNAIGDTPTLGDPIRAAELVSVLNAVSKRLPAITAASTAARQPEKRTPQPASTSSAVTGDEFRFGLALRDLLALASPQMYRIEAGDIALDVIPAARALLIKEGFSIEVPARLFSANAQMRITPLAEMQARRVIASGAKPQAIDWLLWLAGREGPRDHLLPGLPSEARFQLRRWPDFGRLKHDQYDLRMAAHLTRSARSIDELAAASGASTDQARAFVNASALCDLIEVRAREASRTSRPSPARTSPAPAAGGFAGILRSIRSALRMGA
jgi:hypothetical protein